MEQVRSMTQWDQSEKMEQISYITPWNQSDGQEHKNLSKSGLPGL